MSETENGRDRIFQNQSGFISSGKMILVTAVLLTQVCLCSPVLSINMHTNQGLKSSLLLPATAKLTPFHILC